MNRENSKEDNNQSLDTLTGAQSANETSASRAAQSVITHQSIEQKIQVTKDRVRTLNPVRQAKRLVADGTGINNPNVPGQDNGQNAWLDLQLNGLFDTQDQLQVNYGKKNSDANRCFDIDDFSMKGPNHPLKYDPRLAQKARQLMNNDNISVCREMGIRIADNDRMIPQGSRRPPVATTTGSSSPPRLDMGGQRVQQQQNNDDQQALTQNYGDSRNRYFEEQDDDDLYYNSEVDDYDDFQGPEQFESQGEGQNNHYYNFPGEQEYWQEVQDDRLYFRHTEPYNDQPFHFDCPRDRRMASRPQLKYDDRYRRP